MPYRRCRGCLEPRYLRTNRPRKEECSANRHCESGVALTAHLQPPAAGQAAPAGGQAAPAGGQAAPAGGQAVPAGGQASPAGGQISPAGGQAVPAGGQASPVVSVTRR